MHSIDHLWDEKKTLQSLMRYVPDTELKAFRLANRPPYPDSQKYRI